MQAPHPVEDPTGYTQFVLAYLGDDDPIEVQRHTLNALPEVVRDAGDDVRMHPAHGEWSVLQCLAHITDAEIVTSARYRWIAAQDEPTLIAYDQDLWVDRLHAEDDDPESLLHLFSALRRANLAFWEWCS